MAATFQPKVGSPTETVEGIAELEQSFMTVCGTQYKSVPGRPEFGLDQLRLIDLPASRLATEGPREVRRAFRASEPRITIIEVTTTRVDATGKIQIAGRWMPTDPIDPTRPNEVRQSEAFV